MIIATAPVGVPQPNDRVKDANGLLGTITRVDWPWLDTCFEEDILYTITWEDGSVTTKAKGNYIDVEVILN